MKDELNKKVGSRIKRITKEEKTYKESRKKKVVLFPWLKGSQREAAIKRMYKKYSV